MFLEDCKVLENKMLGEGYQLLKVQGEKNIDAAKAGQFFMIKCKNGITVLRRPISLHHVDRENSILEFYFEVKGKGTQELAALKTGEMVNLQGPLGKGFTVDVEGQEIMVIGGGMGNAPVKLVIEELKKRGNKVTYIMGGRNREALNIRENFNLEGVEHHITTDDGSLGSKGNVVEKMKELLSQKRYDAVYTCGPHRMMEAVAETAQKNDVYCEISLEERMACGVKACVGCSIKTLEGMKKVCYDGPVFDSKTIVDVNPKENVGCCKGE